MSKINIKIDIIYKLMRTYLWLYHASKKDIYLQELKSLRILMGELRVQAMNESINYNADNTVEYKLGA